MDISTSDDTDFFEPIEVPLTVQRYQGSVYWVTGAILVGEGSSPIPVVVDTGSFALRTRQSPQSIPCTLGGCAQEESRYVGGSVSFHTRPGTLVGFPGSGRRGVTNVGVGLTGLDPPKGVGFIGREAQGILGVLPPLEQGALSWLFSNGGAPGRESSVVGAMGVGSVTLFWEGGPSMVLAPWGVPAPFVSLPPSPRILVSRIQHPRFPQRIWFRLHRLTLVSGSPISPECGDRLPIPDVWVMLDSGQTNAVAFHNGGFAVQCKVRRPILQVIIQMHPESPPIAVPIIPDPTFPSCMPLCKGLAGADIGRGGEGFLILGVQFLVRTNGFGYVLRDSDPRRKGSPSPIDISWMVL